MQLTAPPLPGRARGDCSLKDEVGVEYGMGGIDGVWRHHGRQNVRHTR